MFQFSSNHIKLTGAADLFQGGRPENQDNLAYCDTPLGFLVVVCDGMGGGPGGKTASTIAVQEIVRTLQATSSLDDRAHAFRLAAGTANEALEQAMTQNPALTGMGSTFVAILISKHSAYVAHAGDSRCYKLRGHTVTFRTQDHSLVGELTQRKVLTEEEARISPQSNVITRGLGSTTNHVPEIEEVSFGRGDRFILCTDGVWGIMPHPDLIQYLGKKCSPRQLLPNLAAEIERRGKLSGDHHDNFTMAIIDMGCSSELTKRRTWKVCTIAIASLLIIALGAFLAFKYCTDNPSSLTNYTTTSTSSTGYNSQTVTDPATKTFYKTFNSSYHSDTTKRSESQPEETHTNAQKNHPPYLQTLYDLLDSLASCKETDKKQACKRQRKFYLQLKDSAQHLQELHQESSEDIQRKIKNICNAITKHPGEMQRVQEKENLYIPTKKAEQTIDSVRTATDHLKQTIQSTNIEKEHR